MISALTNEGMCSTTRRSVRTTVGGLSWAGAGFLAACLPPGCEPPPALEAATGAVATASGTSGLAVALNAPGAAALAVAPRVLGALPRAMVRGREERPAG